MAKTDRTAERFAKLVPMLRHDGTMLIVLQDNPDPDAVAAAAALRVVAHHFGSLQCSLAHGGTVGRAENRALIEYLGLNLRALPQLDVETFDLVAMVDAQPGAGNQSLPATRLPDIVIDHHPIRKDTRACRFTDIRSRYGATSTILLEYLRRAGMTPEMPLATALLYGIRSDTQDLGREATAADIDAVERLYPRVNKRMLSQIMRGRVTHSWFQMLTTALQQAVIHDDAIIASLGVVDNPDMMAEAADLFLRHERVRWTMSYGRYNDKVLVSLRCIGDTKRAEQVAASIASRMGTSGGHATMAGAQIPLNKDTPEQFQRVEKRIRDRFLKAVGLTGTEAEPLVDGLA